MVWTGTRVPAKTGAPPISSDCLLSYRHSGTSRFRPPCFHHSTVPIVYADERLPFRLPNDLAYQRRREGVLAEALAYHSVH
jgi:hypothetical protein